MTAPEPDLAAFLREANLAAPGEDGLWTPLTGGIASDVWRVETSKGCVCVKRALPRLRVAQDWRAPVHRNAGEWAYLNLARKIAPDAIPKPIAHDPHRGLFAMAWLAPEEYPNWKTQLLAGRVDPAHAAAVGDLLGRIHAATAADPSVPKTFGASANDETFHAMRIEPYLLATIAVHDDLAPRLNDIAELTASTKRVLVHGDVSPKNILLGPKGPVLLDAECAWFGDPAFDLAFCLNHLAIKSRVVVRAADSLAESYRRLSENYFAHVGWEPRAQLEARAAALLPALALARVDGKSPLEYLNAPLRTDLRAAARVAMAKAASNLDDVYVILVK